MCNNNVSGPRDVLSHCVNINISSALWFRTRLVFRPWRDMLRMSHVSAFTQSCPSSSLDQKMVRRTPLAILTLLLIHCISRDLTKGWYVQTLPFSLYRYSAYLALQHLPSREHIELRHGESMVCVWPQGLQQCGTRL